MSRISILRTTTPYDRDVVLNSLISAVEEKARLKNLCPDCIFVTGDIAHSGRDQEYVAASAFFNELREVTALDKSRLFIVPGNHDVDRHKGKGLVRSLSSEEESVDFFGPEHPQHHFAKLEAFRQWFNDYFEESTRISFSLNVPSARNRRKGNPYRGCCHKLSSLFYRPARPRQALGRASLSR